MTTKADKVLALADQIKEHREIVDHLETLAVRQVDFFDKLHKHSSGPTKYTRRAMESARTKLFLAASVFPVKKTLTALTEPVTEEE